MYFNCLLYISKIDINQMDISRGNDMHKIHFPSCVFWLSHLGFNYCKWDKAGQYMKIIC